MRTLLRGKCKPCYHAYTEPRNARRGQPAHRRRLGHGAPASRHASATRVPNDSWTARPRARPAPAAHPSPPWRRELQRCGEPQLASEQLQTIRERIGSRCVRELVEHALQRAPPRPGPRSRAFDGSVTAEAGVIVSQPSRCQSQRERGGRSASLHACSSSRRASRRASRASSITSRTNRKTPPRRRGASTAQRPTARPRQRWRARSTTRARAPPSS